MHLEQYLQTGLAVAEGGKNESPLQNLPIKTRGQLGVSRSGLGNGQVLRVAGPAVLHGSSFCTRRFCVS